MKPCVILRAHNDMPLIAETLACIAAQDMEYQLIAFDNDSTDGTLDEIKKYSEEIHNVPRGTYVPGRVLNQAMNASDGEYVVFVNSDCTPQHRQWLSKLLAGFDDPNVAAVFGRQIPRPDCGLLFAKDTNDTFGDGARQKHWKHCFSMASSAIRRSVWEEMQFNENIQYSEDIEWTWRARERGYSIRYAADSVVMHSHNYTLSQWKRRQYGEGKAEAVIFDWTEWDRSLIRYSILPFGRQVLHDWKYILAGGWRYVAPLPSNDDMPLRESIYHNNVAICRRINAIIHAPMLRSAQAVGRRKGFMEGLVDRKSI